MSTIQSVRPAPEPGTRLSHYVIQECIGGGGMGTVYRARDSSLDRDVAIKVINPQIAGDPDRIARFHREARAVAALNHPGIVTIHDRGEENGTTYLVTEFVEGVTLRVLMAKERVVGYRQIADIGSQVAAALAAAHGAGITHRDVKPDNIMITRSGRVKLLDFGLALARRADTDANPTQTSLTGAGVVLGTVGYMSPEQVRGDVLDPRSDIFSLGAVLYEMAAGVRPFTGATTADVASAVLREEPPSLPETSVPTALRLIIERCLQKRAEDRFQSSADLAFALTSIASRTSSIEISDVAAPRRRSRAWLVAAPVAIVLGVCLFGVSRLATSVDPVAPGRLRPFATEGYGEKQPIWSPDGRSLAYVSTIDAVHNIVVKSLNAPSPVPLVRCPAICDPIAWSSDGSRLYYQSRTSHLDARLWSVATTGGEPSPLFQDDVVMLASSLSPDGKRLALLRVVSLPDNGGGRYGLFFSEPPGAQPVRFEKFPLRHLIQPTRIAWSSDSTRLLVFTSSPPGINVVSPPTGQIRTLPMERRTDVSVSADPRFAVVAQPLRQAVRTGLQWLDVDSGRLSPLLSSENTLSYPAVAPDGSKVAYVANETDFDLAEIPLDGSPVRSLLASRLAEHSAHYSPRTNEFVYVAAAETPEIRVRQPSTLAERVLITAADFTPRSAQNFAAPAFSPDGTKIAYNRDFEIWISPANGGTPAKLTAKESSGEFGAEWSPDGKWIAFNYAKPTWGGLVKVRVGDAGDPVRLRPGMCGIVAPAWSPDGNWIACGRGQGPSGLELVPAAGGEPKPLGDQFEKVAVWSRDSDHLYVIRTTGAVRELGELSWRSGQFRRIVEIPTDFVIGITMSWTGRLSLSNDGKSIVTTVERDAGDIWILDGLRPPRSWWQRILRP
jgi:serine/threonine protein kinase/WD40 repeat protein